MYKTTHPLLHFLGITMLMLAVISCTPAKTISQTPENQPKTSVASTPAPPAKPAPFVTWDKKKLDIGKVKRGEKRTMFFEFTNTSGEEIKIEIVDACDCTHVEFPRKAIAPGGKGRLDVTFDSKDKDASETIGINVVFSNVGPDGNPRIEVVEYQFELEK